VPTGAFELQGHRANEIEVVFSLRKLATQTILDPGVPGMSDRIGWFAGAADHIRDTPNSIRRHGEPGAHHCAS